MTKPVKHRLHGMLDYAVVVVFLLASSLFGLIGLINASAGNAAEAARHLRIALDNHLHIESPTATAEARERLVSLEAPAL